MTHAHDACESCEYARALKISRKGAVLWIKPIYIIVVLRSVEAIIISIKAVSCSNKALVDLNRAICHCTHTHTHTHTTILAHTKQRGCQALA
jgi:hypothetical protein